MFTILCYVHLEVCHSVLICLWATLQDVGINITEPVYRIEALGKDDFTSYDFTLMCQLEVQYGRRPSCLPAFISAFRSLPYIKQLKMSSFTEYSRYTMALS